MIDILHAVHACSDLIDYWDVGRRADGVVLRARSRIRYAAEQVATELAVTVGERIEPLGHQVVQVSTAARADGAPSAERHSFLELLIA